MSDKHSGEGDTDQGPQQSRPDYWERQTRALHGIREKHSRWVAKRRSAADAGWKRVTFTLPRMEAQKKAREFLEKYPKAAYWSEVESWRELPGDIIEFTMRRLPTAD